MKKTMFDSIRGLFGREKTNFAQLIEEGALILDVRSKGEYASGHINGSINISVDQLSRNFNKLGSKATPIITCCASGTRSALARNILLSNGFKEVYNGGGWGSLQSKL